MKKMKKMKGEEYSLLTQHLIESGCPLDLSEGYRDTPAGLKFEQVFTLGVNQVFDLDDGGAGYIMDMRISSELNLPIRIRRVKVKMPWGLRDISLLPDPSKRVRGYEYYDFPGVAPAFHRSVVVNDFLSGKCTLNPGGEVQGLLLAVDERSIPDEYPDHGRTIAKLFIFDERGNEFTPEFRLCLDRSAACNRDRLRKTAATSKSIHRRRKFIAAA